MNDINLNFGLIHLREGITQSLDRALNVSLNNKIKISSLTFLDA